MESKSEFYKDIPIGLAMSLGINEFAMDFYAGLDSTTKDKIKKLLNSYGLKEFIYSYPDNLSGGMRQRVALIRTLANNPNLLLMDEPFSALDYQSRLAISDDIYNILREQRIRSPQRKKAKRKVTND